MNLENKGGYNLKDLGKINIILGKNGCGKSTFLKAVDKTLEEEEGLNKYVSPERGGHLQHDPNLENNINRNGIPWISGQLRNNQYAQFKQQSVVQYRKLETITLREIEKNTELRNNHSYTFDTIVEKINSLLTNIEIIRLDSDFEIRKKGTETKRPSPLYYYG
jgi:ATPase subunit of ABC transporter with duplicated ATPase domains